MRYRRRLRSRIIISFALFGLGLTALFAVATVYMRTRLEDQLVNTTLERELRHFVDFKRENTDETAPFEMSLIRLQIVRAGRTATVPLAWQKFDTGVYDAEGTLDAQSSIIAGNSAGDGAARAADLGADDALAIRGANNLVMSADAALVLPADTLHDDPQLFPLNDNGGPTRTHALVATSPAIDAGNNAAALDFDQSGAHFARVSGAAADIGAFEAQRQQEDDVIFKDGFDGAAQPGTPVQYSLDDGDGDSNIGPPSTFSPDMLWGNYFTAQPGGQFITKISIAFGPTFPSLSAGNPVTFWLLEDEDGDGDPRNAYAIASVQGVPDVVNDTFFSVDIPPTWVHDGFFVGASAKLAGGQDRPARIDADGPATAAWFFYAPDIAATIDDLAAAPYGTPVSAAGLPIPGVFMVRATGQDAP